MININEQDIASDFLSGVKSAIKVYASSLTEVTNKDVRETLRNHLMSAIDTHEKITNYMINKNYYYPFDIPKQIDMDLQAIDKLINSGN